ncbi:MAG: hypothetical protein AABY22_05960 [Nanoarchaeota archaeon]
MSNVNLEEFFKLEEIFTKSCDRPFDGFSVHLGISNCISFDKWNNNAFKTFIENIRMGNCVSFHFNMEECTNDSWIYINNINTLYINTWINKKQVLNCTELVITDLHINNMNDIFHFIENYQKNKTILIKKLVKEINDKSSNSSIKTN